MGSSCSSGQAHKDKDSGSTRSEESPSYQATHKVEGGLNSGVVLEVSSEARRQQTSSAAPPGGMVPTQVKPPIGVFAHPPPQCIPSVSDTASPSSPAPADKPGTAVTPLEEEDVSHPEFGRLTSKTAKIVLYICAADSQDCKVEKSVLHNEVYPVLRERCRDRGYELHIVDLHWSLQEKSPEPSELCLHELQRQSERGYVVPVVLLNSTLGSPQLPKTIECADFETAASDPSGVLAKWYRRDTHAQPPCYRLLPASHCIPGFKSENKAEMDNATEEWRAEVEKILSVMLATFTEELRDTYLSTVVEQEVQHTVMMSQEQAKRCLWISRVYTHTQQQSSGSNTGESDKNNRTTPGEAELKRRLQLLQKALKTELNESHMVRLHVKWSADGIDPQNPEHCHYLAQVASTADRHLASVADTIFEEHDAKTSVKKAQGVPGWLLEEIGEQRRWSESCAQCSVNRQLTLEQIQNWNGNGPVIVYGAAGCGKTTLASRLAQTFGQRQVCQPSQQGSARVVFRSANLTPASGSLGRLLLGVVLHARLLAKVLDPTKSFDVSVVHDISNYTKILLEALEAASSSGTQLVVIVDGIDQFREFSERSVEWIPAIIPDNVKLIVTLNDKSALFEPLQLRLKKENSDGTLFVQMSDLDKAEGESILLSSVMEYNHSVNSHVQDCVLASLQKCTLPLYVKVLAWQTSWCSEFDHKLQPKGDLQEQLSNMLDDLELLLDRKLVEMCLCLVTAAKRGLTDSEMLDLLTANKDFHTSTTYLPWAGACIFWSRLNKQLRPFLRHCSAGVGASSVITWRDWSLRKAVETRYSETMAWAHQTLLAYFTTTLWDNSSDIKARMLSQPNKFFKSYNRRKLEEVPYLAYKCKGTCKEYLLDPDWLYDKICGSSVYEVLEDLELEGWKESADLTWLRSLLSESASGLDYDGRQLYSQAGRRAPIAESQLSQKLSQLAIKPPVLSLVHLSPPSVCFGTPESSEKCFDSLVRLPENPWFVVTINTDKEEISVWDIRKCERVRTLKGIPQPLTLQMIDDYRCVVLCKRELRTYDLDNGTLLTKLKGVMNQKMPYYGLHDSRHLVALSRNRMYVNLMNLDTGDLVTTFKAGEDRFLNSLLVSGDGRMLVCGDETQKPFPLLVWNLSSRKLLYDLRIPGHDFITSLSAITHQGHYVCCVAKEVDEPGPNFIVVYDLQSGTLFKKWKPGVDCVAVDISSRDSCVVSGQADGSVLVWDLVTGNCRWKLKGHTAPVNYLRLDPNASACLSADTLARDPAVRIWDLSTGELSAVYTPDSRISLCEVTGKGRHVVLAPLGRRAINCLELRGPDLPDIETDPDQEVYGQPTNRGKVFALEDR